MDPVINFIIIIILNKPNLVDNKTFFLLTSIMETTQEKYSTAQS